MATSKPTPTPTAKPVAEQQAEKPPVVEQQQQTGELAVAGNTAVAEIDDTSFAEFGGQGLEGLGKDDLAIPFLTILQSGSPQCKRSEGAYIEGAAEGMLFNSVTKEVIDPIKTKLLLIPCFYDRNFVEWKVRENGGGFVAQHAVHIGLALLEETMRDEKNRDILRNGNQINDTRTFVVLAVTEDGVTWPAFITMTSTQIKKSRQWLMQQNLLKLKGPNGLYTPPMFASKWRVTTVPEGNDQGTWMGWAFTHEGYLAGPKDPVFVEAQALHKSMKAGTVKVDLSKAAGDEPQGGRSQGGQRGNPQPGADGDDEIPF
jgi:hypothetical protein